MAFIFTSLIHNADIYEFANTSHKTKNRVDVVERIYKMLILSKY